MLQRDFSVSGAVLTGNEPDPRGPTPRRLLEMVVTTTTPGYLDPNFFLMVRKP